MGVAAVGFVSCDGKTSCQRTLVATLRLKSDPHPRRSFILAFRRSLSQPFVRGLVRRESAIRSWPTSIFSCAKKGEPKTSAMSGAQLQPPVLFARHQVPPEDRRTNESAASGQVRSFSAKRAQSVQKRPAPQPANRADAVLVHANLRRILCR